MPLQVVLVLPWQPLCLVLGGFPHLAPCLHQSVMAHSLVDAPALCEEYHMSPQGGENFSRLTLVLSEPSDVRALEMTLDLSRFLPVL